MSQGQAHSSNAPEGPGGLLDRLLLQPIWGLFSEARDGLEEELEAVQQAAQDMLFVFSNEGKVLYTNPAVEHSLGYSTADITGQPLASYVHPGDLRTLARVRQDLTKNRAAAVRSFEARFLCSSGEYRWLDWSVVTAHPERFVYAVARDARSEEAVQSQPGLTPNTLEGIADPVFVFNGDWQLTYINDSGETIAGGARKSLVGELLWELFPDLSQGQANMLLRAAVAKQEDAHFETTELAANRLYRIHAYPTERGLMLLCHDVTDLRSHERELAELDRQYTLAQLAAAMSHEIRNPLAAARGFAQLLADEATGRQQDETEQLEIILSELDRATSVLENLLAAAKLQPQEPRPCSLTTIVEKTLPTIRADALNSAKKVVTYLQPVPAVPLDPQAVRHVVYSLARNGLEAMEQGGCLTLTTEARAEEVLLTVANEGGTFDSGLLYGFGQPALHEKSTTAGLDLAVCYNTVARLGGSVDITTDPDGTTFYVSFPLEHVQT